MEETSAEYEVLQMLRKIVRADDPACTDENEILAADACLHDLKAFIDERISKILYTTSQKEKESINCP